MEKIKLAALPTPIFLLENLSKELGKKIWVKRDDFSGMEYSGNKVRKLEYLFKEAQKDKCDYVLTRGGVQSNHARATAAIAAKLGFSCVLYLTGHDDKENGGVSNGNLLLDRLFGAEVKFVSADEIDDVIAADIEKLSADGHKAYEIPMGGSNSIGARGYMECAREIQEYEQENNIRFDLIAHATGSGGTYSGLLLGGNEWNIVGYSCSESSEYFKEIIYNIAKEVQPDISKERIQIVDEYAGPRYGESTPDGIELIKHVAKTEGIIMDHCYTGKAFFGLVSDIKKGKYEECDNILFIHTGGMFAIFDKPETFLPEIPLKKEIRDMFIGLDEPVEYEDGMKAAVNFDSAATTPPFVKVLEEIQEKLPMYGSIGRGTGQKSQYSSDIYTKGRDTVLDFFNADKSKYSVIYTNSTTDGMNKLASALVESPRDVILTTRMEHHANDLPWRERARTVYVDVDENGRINPEDFIPILEKYNWYTNYSGKRVFRGTIKYVAVSAASNVTGYINDVHRIAEIAHEYGAKIIVDGAQIVAHREFSMKGKTCKDDIDFFVFSAHKMYSPFGGGAIVGLTDVLNDRLPTYYGGGMVDKVTDDDVVYSKVPDRYEAGSPNYPGVVGMLKAMEILKNEVKFENIKTHEEDLLSYALKELNAIGGNQVILYGDGITPDGSVNIKDRVGIIVFNLKRFTNEEVAYYLSWHAAIAVRHAKFCAHTYVNRLLGLTETDKTDKACIAHEGMVRVSFGLYNTKDDVDELVQAVRDMLEGKDITTKLSTRMDRFAASMLTLPNDRG